MRTATLLLVAASLLLEACAGDDTNPAAPGSDASTDATVTPDANADAALPPLEATPPALIPAASRLDATSSPVVFDRLRGGVWTANGDVGSISYVDVDALKVVQEVAIGKDVRSVALSPDARWLAAVDRDGATVTLVQADTRAAMRTIALGTHPRAAVWDAADPRWLYVAVEDADAVQVIDRTLGVLASTIPVGRLPAGLAVSRQRRELYVTHRIDPAVTVVPLDSDADGGAAFVDAASLAQSDGGKGASDASLDADAEAGLPPPPPPPPPLSGPLDVPLALEIGDGAATTPHGRPFAFESLAWAPDGNVAWVPHEILASTHPFQFQTTLFPSVSVVDFNARAEVQTNPDDPLGRIAGRKNLFAAIDLIDETGNVTILSQPCAAAIHPNGRVAYVLACGSEDLLTFDTDEGIATDILRNLPGDHPVGMTLDDTGQRLFVLDDQSEDPSLHSKSLSVLDTANGSLVEHVKLVAGPLALTASDPVDPDLRAGLRLFQRADSSKGTLATTGNDWMSCGGCHLDGFVTTNAAFFAAMTPLDPTLDARIGHTGLADFFSKSPPANDPADPPFDPHDVLVAFSEQAGLAPDRTGAQRAGAVDPSAPTPDAATMAAQVARVIARDLPLGPTWLLPGAVKPNTDYDGAWCGQCHQAEFQAWQKSAHAHSAVDPMVRFGAAVEVKAQGAQYGRLCAGCHDPVTARTGDTSLTSGRGITCLGCHDSERLIGAGGNADVEAEAHEWTQSHKARALAALDTLRQPAFCGVCHQQFVPGTGLLAITTLSEWQASHFATDPSPTRCVDCHAPKNAQGVADHTMIGGNVYLASQIVNDATMAAAEQANLEKAIALSAQRSGDTVSVTVRNVGSGHAFPTGVSDIREPWVELQAVDTQHHPVARYGGPAPDGTIPLTAARLGMDIASADGTLLYLHQLDRTTRIPFALFVPAGGSVPVELSAPSTLPQGAVGLDVVLLYRNVRTPYYRSETGNTYATAPEVEVTRLSLP